MRRGLVAALVCAAVLAMPGAANAAEGDATLERYARDTWASFVAMTDAQQRACRPTCSRATAGAPYRPRRPTSAPTCGARSAAERLGIIGHERARQARATGR